MKIGKRDIKIVALFPYIRMLLCVILGIYLPRGEQTAASKEAISRLRKWDTLEWYVIPLLCLIFYIYGKEIRKARKTGNWDPIIAGAFMVGISMVAENYNGWVLNLTGISGLWMTPGKTAYLIFVGLNFEIEWMFMFFGVIFTYSVPQTKPNTDNNTKPPFISNYTWAALFYTTLCVVVEMLLNYADLLIWEFEIWNRSLIGFCFVFLWYLTAFMSMANLLEKPDLKSKVRYLFLPYTVAALLNIIGFWVFGWNY